MPPETAPRAATGAPLTPATPRKRPADATFSGELAQGARGAKARLVQEWLCLAGVNVAVDGGYGPATAAGVRAFQRRAGLPETGAVDATTFERLVDPMVTALQPIVPAPDDTLGSMVVRYARQHLAQHPREVGGQNMGPWVRLYMDGNQGAAWPWCAGFATFVLRQAAAALGVRPPVARTFSCDVLAGDARTARCFCAGAEAVHAGAHHGKVTPGSLFFVRRTASDWEHVGIVTAAEATVFHTIEGNTNDSGDREGYEVCARVRGYDRKDFVLIA